MKKKIFLWFSCGKVLKSIPLEKLFAKKTEPIFNTVYKYIWYHFIAQYKRYKIKNQCSSKAMNLCFNNFYMTLNLNCKLLSDNISKSRIFFCK